MREITLKCCFITKLLIAYLTTFIPHSTLAAILYNVYGIWKYCFQYKSPCGMWDDYGNVHFDIYFHVECDMNMEMIISSHISVFFHIYHDTIYLDKCEGLVIRILSVLADISNKCCAQHFHFIPPKFFNFALNILPSHCLELFMLARTACTIHLSVHLQRCCSIAQAPSSDHSFWHQLSPENKNQLQCWLEPTLSKATTFEIDCVVP